MGTSFTRQHHSPQDGQKRREGPPGKRPAQAQGKGETRIAPKRDRTGLQERPGDPAAAAAGSPCATATPAPLARARVAHLPAERVGNEGDASVTAPHNRDATRTATTDSSRRDLPPDFIAPPATASAARVGLISQVNGRMGSAGRSSLVARERKPSLARTQGGRVAALRGRPRTPPGAVLAAAKTWLGRPGGHSRSQEGRPGHLRRALLRKGDTHSETNYNSASRDRGPDARSGRTGVRDHAHGRNRRKRLGRSEQRRRFEGSVAPLTGEPVIECTSPPTGER